MDEESLLEDEGSLSEDEEELLLLSMLQKRQKQRQPRVEHFFKNCYMTQKYFFATIGWHDHVLNISHLIWFKTKQKTNFREPISARERLSVTLRFLARGESQQSLSFSYRIGQSTMCNAFFLEIQTFLCCHIKLLIILPQQNYYATQKNSSLVCKMRKKHRKNKFYKRLYIFENIFISVCIAVSSIIRRADQELFWFLIHASNKMSASKCD